MSDTTAPKKGLIAEFKDFVATGDLMTIAVAFIMGFIIKQLIESFIHDIFMGVVGLGIKCKDVIGGDGKPTGAKDCTGLVGKAYKTIAYGSFLNQVISFLVTAFVVFMMVKLYTRVMRKHEAAAGPDEVALLTEIRDELKRRG